MLKYTLFPKILKTDLDMLSWDMTGITFQLKTEYITKSQQMLQINHPYYTHYIAEESTKYMVHEFMQIEQSGSYSLN